jgi:tRNA (cytosine34-C5)-methyltransferase
MLESMMSGDNSLLFANDLSKKRAYMLAFHVLKLNAKCAVLTSNDCTKYPKVVEFDKILCDVPCSGDGTIRKQNSRLHNLEGTFITQ